MQVWSLCGNIPWSRKWQCCPIYLPEKFHGQRNLAGYSPWGHKQSDTTEWLSTHTHKHTHKAICSALEQATSTKTQYLPPQVLTPSCRHWRVGVDVGEHMSKVSLTYPNSPYHSPLGGGGGLFLVSFRWVAQRARFGGLLCSKPPASKQYKWDLNSFLCDS